MCSSDLPSLSSEAQRAEASAVRGLLAAWKEGRDLVEIGAYKPGTNSRLDAAIALRPAVELLLRQGTHETTPLPETRELVGRLAQAAVAQEKQARDAKPASAGLPQRGRK